MIKSEFLNKVSAQRDAFALQLLLKISALRDEIDQQLEKAVSCFKSGDDLSIRIASISTLPASERRFLTEKISTLLSEKGFTPQDYTLTKMTTNVVIVTFKV